MTERAGGRPVELVAAVAGGPLAWLAQMNLLYPLVGDPCFTASQRQLSYPANGEWSFVVGVLVYLTALLVSLGAAWLSLRLLKRLKGRAARPHQHFEKREIGRLRFSAYCGMLLGVGFSILILLNGLSLMVIHPCAL